VLHKDAKIELIKSVPLFSHCTKKELAAIATAADEVDLPAGKELAREGDRGREFCVIVEGIADVRRRGRRVNELGAGDFFGEIALITGGARTATVTTTSPVRALVLTDRAFRSIVNATPSVQGSVMKALAERLHADSL
jgi:CRP/FNR family transcriptional regulator, cyclic AMP receptor protein